MSCSGCKKKVFTIVVNDKDVRITGLDQCVLGVYISFPENDDDIFEMMWEQVQIYNPDFTGNKPDYREVLISFYHQEKENLSSMVYQTGCTGDCCG